MQSRGLLGRLLGPLLKTGLPLIKNESGTDVAIQNKNRRSGVRS